MFNYNSFESALRNRNVRYFRFNNSSYWKNYYKKKLKDKDFIRERKYSYFLHDLLKPKARVLDAACGLGFLAMELKRKGFDIYAIDLFNEMIKDANNNFKKNKLKITLIKSDVIQTPFKKNFFDAICAISIIEHLTKQEIISDFLLEMRRILKTKGYFLVHMPIRTPFSYFTRLFRKYITRDLPKWAIDDDSDVTHKVWFTLDEYKKILEEEGFEILDYCLYSFRSNRKPLLLWYFGQIIANIIPIDFNNNVLNKNNEISWNFQTKFTSSLAITADLLCRKI